jgi:hypothetical protein
MDEKPQRNQHTTVPSAELNGKACGNTAPISHGSSGFKVTGFFRFDANVIPNHFSIINNSATPREDEEPKFRHPY